MPRLDTANESWVSMTHEGETVGVFDNVEAAERDAMHNARRRAGRDYFVAKVISRFGLPNADPVRVMLLANDMADAPAPVAQPPVWPLPDLGDVLRGAVGARDVGDALDDAAERFAAPEMPVEWEADDPEENP